MLLTGLSVALSKNDSCKITQAGIRNAGEKTFQTEFINIHQNLHLNLGAIFIDFSV